MLLHAAHVLSALFVIVLYDIIHFKIVWLIFQLILISISVARDIERRRKTNWNKKWIGMEIIKILFSTVKMILLVFFFYFIDSSVASFGEILNAQTACQSFYTLLLLLLLIQLTQITFAENRKHRQVYIVQVHIAV